MTCYENYHLNKTIFSPLEREELVPKEHREIIWNALTMTYLDPYTTKCELEV